MTKPATIIDFAAFHKPAHFLTPPILGENIASLGTGEKTGNAPDNKGLEAPTPTPPKGTSGVNGKGAQKTKKTKAAVAKLLPTPGPMGLAHDLVKLSPTDLRLAYGGEYVSWRNSKSRCKKKGWFWAPAWNEFAGFLGDMGPKAHPKDTLDRLDSKKHAYGPGLCRWASKVVQANNKTNNFNIVVPLTGEVLSVPKLAKMHAKPSKTIYNWIAAKWSVLELLAGKRSPGLSALSAALDKLPKPAHAPKPRTASEIRFDEEAAYAASHRIEYGVEPCLPSHDELNDHPPGHNIPYVSKEQHERFFLKHWHTVKAHRILKDMPQWAQELVAKGGSPLILSKPAAVPHQETGLPVGDDRDSDDDSAPDECDDEFDAEGED